MFDSIKFSKVAGFKYLHRYVSSRGIPELVCPICDNPRHLDIVNLVLTSKISVTEAMQRLNCEDREVFEKHLKEHIRVTTGSEGAICAVEKKTLDGVGVLTNLANRLNGVASKILDDLENNAKFDLSLIGPATNLVKEIRSSARVIAELNGDIETKYVVELRIQQNTINQLQNFLMTELCPEDRAKVLAFLSKELGMK